MAVAIIAWLLDRESKKRKAESDKLDKRAEIRVEESRLSMNLMSAIAKLTSVTAVAMKEGHTNGKMDRALADVEKAQGEYYNFINRIASKQMTAD